MLGICADGNSRTSKGKFVPPAFSTTHMFVVRFQRWTIALSFVICMLVPLAASAESGLEPLEITTSSGIHKFEVEIAKDEASQEKGLMYRKYMPANRGMLFEFDRDEPEAFWMKNTYIPLDMIFIGPDGVVTHVAANAEPLSEAVVSSGGPCIAVLELNGGVASGLVPGDKVRAAFFKP
jgi:uncharacterized protein